MEKIAAAIMANLPVGLLVIGGDGKIIEANPSACSILGCQIEGFVGNSWGDIFLSQEENLEFTEVVLDAIQKETPKIERITPYFAPDGKKRYLSVISSAQRTKKKISAIVVIIEDLTELYEMHEREKNILAINHRLASARAESLIAFARSVAHQIRNPITAIAGFSRLITRKADKASLEPLEAIIDETHKLETIVRAVAEYSAIAIKKVTPTNLWVLVEDAKHLIQDHPSIKAHAPSWDTECPDMSILVDHELMIQALSEVFINSTEFNDINGTITICAKEKGGDVTITITDSGPGFTPDGLKMAFDPFFTTKAVGAGMGLTRAKRIVTEHQGTIEISNTDDNHGHVIITLPVEPL